MECLQPLPVYQVSSRNQPKIQSTVMPSQLEILAMHVETIALNQAKQTNNRATADNRICPQCAP